jgi:opacity protein-like surface antigen
MIRTVLGVLTLTLVTTGVATAQETKGAGHIEIDGALLGGGVLVLPTVVSLPRGYVIDVAGTANVTRRIGLEADFAWALGRSQTVGLNSLTPTIERTPGMLFYTGNVVYNPLGHNHPLIPYLEVGGGGMTVRSAENTPAFGLATSSTHLTANLGGGIRWFVMPHWGVRVDYRYIAIRNDDSQAVLGAPPVGHAQRVYGAVILTF